MKPNPLMILIAAALVVCAWNCSRVEGEDSGYEDLPADRIEVLTRGPVHEAFAKPITLTEENVVTGWPIRSRSSKFHPDIRLTATLCTSPVRVSPADWNRCARCMNKAS